MLTKISFKPGVNRENTRYTNEGGYYESEKIRFRQGTPEKLGGWVRISANMFLGLCRSLWTWVSLAGTHLTGVGTNLKFYVESGAAYYDITPIRRTQALTNPFTATNGSTSILVTDTAHGAFVGDFVTFSGALTLGGNITAVILNANYQIVTVPTVNTYTITTSVAANASDTGNGGTGVTATYEISVGPAIQLSSGGWGSGGWGSGTWGGSVTTVEVLRLWSQSNFGENLVFCPRFGAIYYWTVSGGLGTRAVNITTLGGASDAPTVALMVGVSDTSRIVIAFGVNQLGSGTLDPLLVRWSDQESVTNWTPSATTLAGFQRLSRGSTIVAWLQTRQEILIWTDTALYSMQYVGYPTVYSVQLIASGLSILAPNAVGLASGVVYWMGIGKFYVYDGTVHTLSCDLRQYIFEDINLGQNEQIFAGVNEGFNEVWWWYCPAGSTTCNKYVIYNYLESIWYYGTMGRTAWIDVGIDPNPIAATYSNNLVAHEMGVDDNETGTPMAINSYVLTSEFDLVDGYDFAFVWRMLPDITFGGSTTTNPSVVMTLYPLKNSGSGYTNPASVAGSNYGTVTRTSTVTVEQFTGVIFTRLRGRQLAFKVQSTDLGVMWQLGSPRIQIQPDGNASGSGVN